MQGFRRELDSPPLHHIDFCNKSSNIERMKRSDTRHYFVYKTTNIVNGKIYIGVHRTFNINDRYLGSGTSLQRAIKKYGRHCFIVEILHTFNNAEDMLAKERELVTEEFVKKKDTYNQTVGGDDKLEFVNKSGKNLYGKNLENFLAMIKLGTARTKELRKDPEWVLRTSKILSAAQRKSYETRSGSFLGKHHKPETKAKIGAKNKIFQSGSGNSQYGTCWITNGSVDKKVNKTNLDRFVSQGWKRGRSLKLFVKIIRE